MKKAIWPLLSCAWLAVVAAGIGGLMAYEYTPGPAGDVPGRWPPESKLNRATSQSTLVMFAHPECPCTRASIGELAILMAQDQGRLRAYVVFLDPAGADDDWLHSDLWRSAGAIPGVLVRADPGGGEMRNFGATTSGQVLLYGADKNLLFSGGITSSRGHYGDNAGLSAILDRVHQEPTPVLRTPVFGCSLLDPAPALAGVNTTGRK